MVFSGRQRIFLQPVPFCHGDGGVGALRGPHSHPEIPYMALEAEGGGMWVSNCLFGVVYFDLGDGEGVHD